MKGLPLNIDGLLFNDPLTPATLDRAIKRHRLKLGTAPTVCYVGEAGDYGGGGVEVRVAANVQPGHFWIGKVTNE